MSHSLNLAQEAVYSDFRDDEDFVELIEMFVGSMPEKIEFMKTAFSDNNLGQLQTYAHQLKGSGAGYGFSGLSEVAAELEQACKNSDLVAITGKLEIVLNYLSRVTL